METQQAIRVIWGSKEGEVREASAPALLEVPGEWAIAVMSLIEISLEHRHNGLLVTNIGPGGQGATAGMVRGDVLLRYDGAEIENVEALRGLEKRHAQDGEVRRTVSIDAARGDENLSFEVHGGHLGITVSPLLHRLRTLKALGKNQPRPLLKIMAGEREMEVIRTLEEARRHDPQRPALIEVPRQLASKIVLLVNAAEASDQARARRMARSLLSTAQA